MKNVETIKNQNAPKSDSVLAKRYRFEHFLQVPANIRRLIIEKDLSRAEILTFLKICEETVGKSRKSARISITENAKQNDLSDSASIRARKRLTELGLISTKVDPDCRITRASAEVEPCFPFVEIGTSDSIKAKRYRFEHFLQVPANFRRLIIENDLSKAEILTFLKTCEETAGKSRKSARISITKNAKQNDFSDSASSRARKRLTELGLISTKIDPDCRITRASAEVEPCFPFVEIGTSDSIKAKRYRFEHFLQVPANFRRLIIENDLSKAEILTFLKTCEETAGKSRKSARISITKNAKQNDFSDSASSRARKRLTELGLISTKIDRICLPCEIAA